VRKLAALGLSAGLALSSWAVARALGPRAARAWPDSAAPLSAPATALPAGFGTRRVYVDAGHGAPGNTGNKGAYCRDEQDFTVSLAEDLGAALARTGHFEVELSRTPGRLVPYAERVREAEAWPADVVISLHSDVRGRSEPWQPTPTESCPRSHQAPGFSVLWSDHGDAPLVARRLELSRALALALERTGFLAYDGADYAPTYAPDVQQRGVFVDRHSTAERVFVLWRPNVPSIIVETHNALDDREARRWDEPETRAAFAASVVAALGETLRGRGPDDH